VRLLTDDSIASSNYRHFASAIQELLKFVCEPMGRQGELDHPVRGVRQLF
jgi:hypothetical protein